MPFYCSFYSIPRSMGIDCLLLQENKKTWLLDCLSRHIYSIFVLNWPLVTTNHVISFLSRSILSDSILKCLHKENVCSFLRRISKKTFSLFVFYIRKCKKGWSWKRYNSLWSTLLFMSSVRELIYVLKNPLKYAIKVYPYNIHVQG